MMTQLHGQDQYAQNSRSSLVPAMIWYQLGDQPPPEPDEGLLSVQYINKNVCNHVCNLIVLDAYLDTYFKKVWLSFQKPKN